MYNYLYKFTYKNSTFNYETQITRKIFLFDPSYFHLFAQPHNKKRAIITTFLLSLALKSK